MPRTQRDIVVKIPGSDRYYANVTVRDPDGRSHRLRHCLGTTDRSLARAILSVAVRDIALGLRRDAGPQPMTLEAAFGRYWLDHVCLSTGEPQLASARDIWRMCGKFLEIMPAGIHLHEISDAVLADWRARRRGQPTPRGGVLSPRSINAEIVHLRAVHHMARDVWRVKADAEPPVNFNRHRLREPDPRTRTLTADEQQRLLAAITARARHLEPIIRAGVLTGLRTGNLLALDWRDVDLRSRVITVRVKSKQPGGRVLRLPIAGEMLALLANLGPAGSGPVFTYSKKRKPIRSIRRSFRTACEAAGIEEVTPRDLRKTFGTRVLFGSGNLRAAQKALGHSEITTTMHYLNVDADNVADAVEAAARLGQLTKDSQKPARRRRKAAGSAQKTRLKSRG
ncbi:tyrosine-type recombinase/integrase [Oceanibacterium hippocampi]|uniref:Tyrosine recombinase XerC n=1 Tax=Oceanibacterium hippocampi TaxID=745714 RepID=A0A1Y5TZF1_9PROT|nr:site-specific integrase [Oceanibacterium hippocampi]SLN77521.1 Tyrosine recombinase XerC [Oceanibacterium hippocampi]